jgi:large subunit ribosomal protein L10
MLRSQKVETIAALRDRFQRMTSAVFMDFRGLTVEHATALRERFREKGVDYRVVNNKLVLRAVSGTDYSDALTPALKGMTAIAWCYEDPSAGARVARDFAKQNEKLRIKAGLLEGQVLDARAVETQLATLPNKDEARAMLLATLLAPAQTLVRLLNAPAQQMVGVLDARKRDHEADVRES